jgi:capsular polysaccharide biosynthesis protein
MSGEIDTSLFMAAVRRRWWIILLCIALALVVAAAIGLAQARRYEAANVLLVQAPRYQWRFANEITAITDQRRDFQREVLAIARSDEIAQAAAATLQSAGPDQAVSPQTLQGAVTVRAGDGNTIVVNATAEDADRAAAYARAWTQALVAAARDVYGAVQDLASFQEELRVVEMQMLEKEEALAQIRARTGLYGTTNVPDEVLKSNLTMQQLNRLNEDLAQYLLDIENLRYIRSTLAATGVDADLVQLPWELLDSPVLSQRGVVSSAIARASLDNRSALSDLLLQEETALQATVEQLQRQAAQLQATSASDWMSYSIGLRELTQARDAHQVLLRKVNELNLQERLDPSLLSVVGSAEPVVSHVRAPMLGLLATATVAGLIVGVLVAVWVEQSRRRERQVQPTSQAGEALPSEY